MVVFRVLTVKSKYMGEEVFRIILVWIFVRRGCVVVVGILG